VSGEAHTHINAAQTHLGLWIMHILGVSNEHTQNVCNHETKCVWASSPTAFGKIWFRLRVGEWKKKWSSTFVLPTFKTCCWLMVRDQEHTLNFPNFFLKIFFYELSVMKILMDSISPCSARVKCKPVLGTDFNISAG